VPQRRVPVGSVEAEPFADAVAVQLNDQHLHLELPADSTVAVGDRIEFGISHPCTTMDKWRTIALVDEGGTVEGAITTRF
jgi:D-serine dehydratase